MGILLMLVLVLHTPGLKARHEKSLFLVIFRCVNMCCDVVYDVKRVCVHILGGLCKHLW